MNMKVLVTHAFPREGLEKLQEATEVYFPEKEAFSETEMLRLAPEVDAIVAAGTLPLSVLEAATRLKVISNYGAGYDNIDVAAATRKGVPVVVIPQTVTDPTAELAIGLMLAVSRRIAELSMRLREGTPEAWFGIGKYMGHTLRGATLGIVGMGKIGRRVAEMARALGMDICYTNRHRLPEAQEEGAAYLPLEELLAHSRVLTLHCPLTPETHGLIGARELSMLPLGAMVINAARGAIIDNEALADALEAGALFGAGVDVYPDEPHVPARLLALPNVVATPHIGSNTVEDRREMARALSENILQVLAGGRVAETVNPEVYQDEN